MDVGFQLSYLAVIGIVFIFPKIYLIWETDNWLLDKIWAIITISIAAQLATFPLGLLYFHQFPWNTVELSFDLDILILAQLLVDKSMQTFSRQFIGQQDHCTALNSAKSSRNKRWMRNFLALFSRRIRVPMGTLKIWLASS